MVRFSGPVKWLLVPASAVALGYGVVGPHFAARKLPHIPKVLGLSTSAPDPEPDPVEPKPTVEPKVTVGVHPVGESPTPVRRHESVAPASPPTEETPKPRRRRRRRRTVETSTPRERTPDPASTPDAPPATGGPDPASTPDG